MCIYDAQDHEHRLQQDAGRRRVCHVEEVRQGRASHHVPLVARRGTVTRVRVAAVAVAVVVAVVVGGGGGGGSIGSGGKPQGAQHHQGHADDAGCARNGAPAVHPHSHVKHGA